MKPFISQHIAENYRSARSSGTAIALYRLPGAKQVQHISGIATHRLKEGEKAFAFAAFDPAERPYFIIPTSSKGLTPKPPKGGLNSLSPNVLKPPSGGLGVSPSRIVSNTQKQFTTLVTDILSAIGKGPFKKIVAARVLAIRRPKDFNELAFFEKVCAAYPHAFASLTYIPGVGLWIGASPEVLASQDETELITYSLAGTKAVDDRSKWTEKEIEEQQIVTDFIRKKLEKINGGEIKTQGPAPRRAGKLKHLLTTFTIHTSQSNLWQKVVKALHPTPAVSGLPKDKSIKFLRENEHFDRRFYAGYLGPVNDDGKTNIFVNLRCMELTEGHILFYAGCGVTQGSDPGKEWLESERKIDILKRLL